MEQLQSLVGKTIESISIDFEGDLNIICVDGAKYRFYHDQDCCESVSIDEITGELEELIGSPIIKAEERCNSKTDIRSETWTFYEFATNKGSVTVKWYGESNGYYSESVDLEYIPGK